MFYCNILQKNNNNNNNNNNTYSWCGNGDFLKLIDHIFVTKKKEGQEENDKL